MYKFQRKVRDFDLPDYGKIFLLEPTHGLRQEFLTLIEQAKENETPFSLQLWVIDQTLCDEHGSLAHQDVANFPVPFLDQVFDLALNLFAKNAREKKETVSPSV